PSFSFNAPATAEIYTLSLHDALPISNAVGFVGHRRGDGAEHDSAGADEARECAELGGRDRRQVQDDVERRADGVGDAGFRVVDEDRKSTRLNSSHDQISYAVFCLKKK